MTGDLRINRREFCRTASTAIAALDHLVSARMGFSQEAGDDSRTAKLNPAQTFWILTAPQPTAQEELAARELARGLRKLGITSEPKIAQLQSAHPTKQDAVFTIAVEHDRFKHPDACEIAADGDNKHGPEIRVKLSGARPQSTLYAVFDFLQQQGAFFGLDGEVYPLDPGQTLSLPVAGNPWRSQHQEFASDYDEGFVFWKGYAIPESLIQSQKEVAAALQGLVSASSGPAERARLEYLSKHVALLVPYADAWVAASRLHQLIQQAVELKRGGKAQEARAKVEAEGIPLWVMVATKVREVILDFQQIISTRNDLGTLASMHNKLVRLALVRLPASIKEVLDELPETVRQIQAEAAKPDSNERARLFVPTRPTILFKGESVRLSAVVAGPDPVSAVTLFTRLSRHQNWVPTRMLCAGRRTYTIQLGPFNGPASSVDYYVQAELPARKLTAPLEVPLQTCTITLV